MQTLNDLNLFSVGSTVEVTDTRPSNVIFTSEFTFDRIIKITGTTISVPVQVDIEEIINYQTANVRYRATIISDYPTFKNNSSITWPTLPAGITAVSGDGVYTLSGFIKPQDWRQVRSPTWTLPANYNTYNNFAVKMEIIWYSSSLDRDISRSWLVYDPDFYFLSEMIGISEMTTSANKIRSTTVSMTAFFTKEAEEGNKVLFRGNFNSAFTFDIFSSTITPVTMNATLNNFASLFARPKVDPWVSNFQTFNYTSGQSQRITGIPQFVDLNLNVTYTVTITPTRNNAINTFTSLVTGGTFSVNTSTKIVTITGTPTQVNNRLQNLFLVSNVNQDWDFELQYFAANNLGETTTGIQRLKSINQSFMSTVVDETFSTNILEDITTPSITNTAVGNFRLDVTTDIGTNINTFSAQWAALNWDLAGQYNFSPTPIAQLGGAPQEITFSQDGTRLVCSSQDTLDGGGFSVRIFTVSDRNLTQEVRIVPDEYGELVGLNYTWLITKPHINADGTRIVFAVWNSTSGLVSNIYVFTRSGTTWTRQHKIQNNSVFRLAFNLHASNDGNYISVSAPQHPGTVNTPKRTGQVVIYRWTGSAWVTQTIEEPVPGDDKEFGWQTYLTPDGRYLLVKSRYASDSNTLGSTYVYFRSSTTFALQATIPDVREEDDVSRLTSDGTRLAKLVQVNFNDNTNWRIEIWRRISTTWSIETQINYSNNNFAPGGKSIAISLDGTLVTLNFGQTNNNIRYSKTYKLIDNVWYPQETVTSSDAGFFFNYEYNLLGNNLISFSAPPSNPPNPTLITFNRWDQIGYVLIDEKANISDFSSGTKTYTFIGDRNNINLALTSFRMNSSATNNIDLIYKLTTPNNTIIFRNQRLTRN